MDELVRWLGQQLDEDERTARAAAEPEQWVELNRAPQQSWSVEYWADPDRAAVVAGGSSAHPVAVTTQGMADTDAEARAAHIATHDPARVLREIDAKRQILRDLEQAEFTLSKAQPGTMPHDLMTGAVNYLRRAVRHHAAVYDQRPGYKEEWRP
ncbi:DUF6221 family protein [Streptomyces sp. NPDC127091]|uniref:DUF6221 family protein n=1 Tax=Streptomyces sp. NPDC127091 TaxID=3347134 RepID=UPI00364B13FC